MFNITKDRKPISAQNYQPELNRPSQPGLNAPAAVWFRFIFAKKEQNASQATAVNYRPGGLEARRIKPDRATVI
jgi:hypothetical protein